MTDEYQDRLKQIVESLFQTLLPGIEPMTASAKSNGVVRAISRGALHVARLKKQIELVDYIARMGEASSQQLKQVCCPYSLADLQDSSLGAYPLAVIEKSGKYRWSIPDHSRRVVYIEKIDELIATIESQK